MQDQGLLWVSAVRRVGGAGDGWLVTSRAEAI